MTQKPKNIDGRSVDRRVYVMARAMARSLYPTMTEADLDRPALQWNAMETTTEDADFTVWQSCIPEAEAALAALRKEGFLP